MSKDIVLKPTGAVQIANRFTLIERKLLNGIIWDSQRHRFDVGERSLSVSDVFRFIGQEHSRNHDIIKDALRNLTTTAIEWNTFGEDRSQEWGICTFLASAKISRGRVKYRLNPEIVEKINHPILFAKIQLLIQSQLKKRHALVLYEFFIDCLSRRKLNRLIIEEVPLEKIKKLLGIVDTKAAEDGNYKFFNRDVLKSSIQEINKNTDVETSYKPIRKRRKVVALTFTLERKKNFQITLSLTDQESLEESKLDRPDKLDRDQQACMNRLTATGISAAKARQLVMAYDTKRISNNLALVEKEQASGKAFNISLAAYLIRAIEEDYGANLQVVEAKQAEEKCLRQDAELRRQEEGKRAEQLEQLRREFDKQRLQHALDELSVAERQTLETRFETANKCNPVFRKWFRGDYGHPAIRGLFQVFASTELLGNFPEAEFTTFLETQSQLSKEVNST